MLIKLFVLSCVLICCVYGDAIQVVVVLFSLLVTLYSSRCYDTAYCARSRWPQHVGCYAVYLAVNSHICMCTVGRVSHKEIPLLLDHEELQSG
jgi:hypothetical protein